MSQEAPIAAEVLLRSLREHEVEYFFCNPGTDFPAIVEAFSSATARGEIGTRVPRPVVVPHENAAVAMAHGVALLTGRPQAVMVHVNVGTANMINGAANASRDQTPVLLMAGRTPVTESGQLGSRNRVIHWAQEMYDQAGMLREFVKWDMELKTPLETGNAVARAMELMMASPQGPAYLSLPREVLSMPVLNDKGNDQDKGDTKSPRKRRAVPTAPHPDPAAIETLAQWLAAAERPLIITSAAGKHPGGVEALANLAARAAVPVVTVGGRYLCLPTSHPMHLGFVPKALLEEADLVIVLECDVPWLPALEGPPDHCKVVHIGRDPAFVGYPTRSFPADLSIVADSGHAMRALEAAFAGLPAAPRNANSSVDARRLRLAQQRETMRAAWAAQREAARASADIKPEWISHCLSEAIDADTIIVNEYPLRLEHCPREQAHTFFGLSPAGGLGWGLGAAIGAKLARPASLVVATLGDGAYMFDNPTACHWVSARHKLPILVLIFNNQMYGAVRNSTASMYAQGESAGQNCELLADLSPSPDFEKVVTASGGYGEKITHAAELPAALARALHAVKNEGRQAVLNIVCKY